MATLRADPPERRASHLSAHRRLPCAALQHHSVGFNVEGLLIGCLSERQRDARSRGYCNSALSASGETRPLRGTTLFSGVPTYPPATLVTGGCMSADSWVEGLGRSTPRRSLWKGAICRAPAARSNRLLGASPRRPRTWHRPPGADGGSDIQTRGRQTRMCPVVNSRGSLDEAIRGPFVPRWVAGPPAGRAP